MKFYISTRFSVEQLRLKAIKLKDELQKYGHEITFDWMSYPNLKPYDNNIGVSSRVAKEELDAVRDADFYIILPDLGGTSMYTEFGVAIMCNEMTGKPFVYLLNDTQDVTLFNYHPAVNWKKTLEEILEDLQNKVSV